MIFRFICLVGLLAAAALQTRAESPNILIIVADDLGWNDVSYHGSKIPTPNIDRLAAEGIELDRHYVAPMCTPTRTALLTGRYWSRFGNRSPSNTRVLPWKTETLASALKAKGYTTHLTGKWHLGSTPEWGPAHFGFDHSYGSLAGGTGPWNHRYKKGAYSKTWHLNGHLVEEEGHVTDLIANQAVRTLHTASESDQPFFLYVPFTAPHNPFDEPAAYRERAKAEGDPERLHYSACVMHLDDAIGRILAALKETKADKNTLTVFFSDNGGTIHPSDGDDAKYPGTYEKGLQLGRNTPLRGRKRDLYEGGIRVPAIAHWPDRLAPKKVTTPIHVIDWMPTFSHLTGANSLQQAKWDGANLWPLLSDDTPLDPRHLYWQGTGKTKRALLGPDNWKLIFDQQSPEKAELFHLSSDPKEENNLADTESAKVKTLLTILQSETARDNDALPSNDLAKDPK